MMECLINDFGGKIRSGFFDTRKILQHDFEISDFSFGTFDFLPPNEWSYTSTPPIRLHGAVLS
jgi:hypothetical protein